MIEQATGSNTARTELDSARASSMTPQATQDFAQVLAGLFSERVHPAPGIAQVVRDELKNANKVSLSAIATDEMTSPSQPQATPLAARGGSGQPRSEPPAPDQAPPVIRQNASPEQGAERSAQAPARSAGAGEPPAQTAPIDAQARPTPAQRPQQVQTPAVSFPPAASRSSTSSAAGEAGQGSMRMDAMAGLARSGLRADQRPAPATLKNPSQRMFHVEKQQLPSQVSRSLAGIIARGGGKLILRLTPQALGDVRVDVQVREGSASALFQAEHESARDLLKSNLATLRHALEIRGVRVERLEVVGPHSESTAPASESARIDGRESGGSGQHQPWHGGSTGPEQRAPAEAGGGKRFEPEAEPGSATGPCVMVQRSIEGAVLRLDAIA